MNTQIVPGATEMRRYLDQGLSQQKIADAWERDTGIRVTRAAIGMAISRYGLSSSASRDRYGDLIPWEVEPEHRQHKDLRLLRLEARRRRGKALTERELLWLTNWKNELRERNAVVHYDPLTPQGFWQIERQPGDDDLIHRPEK